MSLEELILKILKEKGGAVTTRDLTDMGMKARQSTISHATRNLEEKGLVVRKKPYPGARSYNIMLKEHADAAKNEPAKQEVTVVAPVAAPEGKAGIHAHYTAIISELQDENARQAQLLIQKDHTINKLLTLVGSGEKLAEGG